MGWYANQKLGNDEIKKAKAARKRGEEYTPSAELTGWRARAIESEGKLAQAAQARKDAKSVREDIRNRPDLIATCYDVYLFPNEIISLNPAISRDAQLVSFPTAGISAQARLEGQLSVSNRATLTRSLALGSGWQKEKTVDTRTTYLTIDGPEFQWVVSRTARPPTTREMTADLRSGTARSPHEFAALVTTAGRQAGGHVQP